jgi:hypothetical protein
VGKLFFLILFIYGAIAVIRFIQGVLPDGFFNVDTAEDADSEEASS